MPIANKVGSSNPSRMGPRTIVPGHIANDGNDPRYVQSQDRGVSVDLTKVIQRPFPTLRQTYEFRDTILYALGLGVGADPLSERDLPFVYEEGLKAIPSMAAVLASPGFWLSEPQLGAKWEKVLHGEQHIILSKPIPPSGTIRGEFKLIGVEDKGADKGATVFLQRSLYNDATNELLAVVRVTTILRGDGGCGSYGDVLRPPSALPTREPDLVVDVETLPRQALIYRLSGDYNPIHGDPKAAKRGGFDRPILHGLCTYGIATYAVLQNFCDGQPEKLKEVFVRFSSPVFPGDTIRLEFYREDDAIRFRARVPARNIVVLDRGLAKVD
jgi:acyl dehydratase